MCFHPPLPYNSGHPSNMLTTPTTMKDEKVDSYVEPNCYFMSNSHQTIVWRHFIVKLAKPDGCGIIQFTMIHLMEDWWGSNTKNKTSNPSQYNHFAKVLFLLLC